MAVVTRISTMSLQQRTVSDFTRVQSDVFRLQNQISSGLKADDFRQLSGDVEQFTSVEAEIDKLTTLSNNNTENIGRFQTARSTIDQIVSVVDDMENFLTLRRDGAMEDNMQFTQQMTDMRLNLTRELNTTVGGLFIFGGTRTDLPPVIDDPVPTPSEIGTPDTSYYQGSTENLVVRVAKNYDIEFDVRADNEAFQNVMGAIALALQAHAEDDETQMANALVMMQEGLDGIIAVQSKLDARLVMMQDIEDRNDMLKKQFMTVKEDLINTDILTASTQLASEQTILQATFQAFGRISSLSLMDYLK